jgi:two-component system OmpR family sensor kinase
MALSFRARLTLRWTLVFAGMLAIASVAIYAAYGLFIRHELDTQVRTLAATELASSLDGTAMHLHEMPVASLNNAEHAAKVVQLLDADGRVLLQTPWSGLPPLIAGDLLRAAAAGGVPFVDAWVLGRPARATALATTRDGRRYVLVVGLFVDHLHASQRRLVWVLVGVWLAGVLSTALASYLVAAQALRSIERIRAQAAVIAAGNFSARLDPPVEDDEIGRMTRLLNDMLERLHAAIQVNRRFAADASHELRTPLTAMAGEIDVALKRERSPQEYRDTLRTVRAELDGLGGLTADLMLLVRAQEREEDRVVREVPVRRLVDAAWASTSRLAAERGVRLAVDVDPSLVVYGDQRLLERAVTNLLANAVQHNRDGGGVAVRARDEPPPAESWRPGEVAIEVADDGPGIPEAEWERVFDRFHRVDTSRSRRTGGAGLGLAIARAVAGVSGGSVRVVRSSPAGTTFELRLPGGSAEPGAPAGRSEPFAAGVAAQG